MRINKFLAQATGISRRAADAAITLGEVRVNDQPPTSGQDVSSTDIVSYQNRRYTISDIEKQTSVTVMFNKPAGYVVSRNGQGSRTIYDLLPQVLHDLKPVGRLDKASSGLLLLTNDGDLAHHLTHPSYRKVKRYEVHLDHPLQPLHRQMISEFGLQLEDGLSKLQLDRLDVVSDNPRDTEQNMQQDTAWLVTMHEGRNRQIRRTFQSLGYEVTQLHRTQFGDYFLDTLPVGKYKTIF